jgi:hypothetical protein
MKNKIYKTLTLLCSMALFFLMFVYNTSILTAMQTKPRFRDNQNGTITDTKTGLMWQKYGKASVRLKWQAAIEYCKNFGLAEYSDWRLPTIDELKALLNITVGDGRTKIEKNRHNYLNNNGFRNLQSTDYWSASTYAGNTNKAWYVYMFSGNVYYANKDHYGYVLAVRSGG